MPRRAPPPDPTPEHQTESDRVSAALPQAVVPDRPAPADRPATKGDANTFGATEFAVRDAFFCTPLAA